MARGGNNFIDITGKKFNRLTVLKRKSKRAPLFWLCRCDCGSETIVRGDRVRTGAIKSCGCLVGISNIAKKTKHGCSPRSGPTHEYVVWSLMKQRCYNPKVTGYDRYGGAGITVCARWRRSFKNFIHDMGRAPTISHTLDRFPGRHGNYKPSNCRWATRIEQARNSDKCRLYEFNGRSKCLPEWCEILGLKYSTIHGRLRRGWTTEKAFSKKKFTRGGPI